jgi:L-alanine-DL-glutamate epimerase-like enolase superfamily enzyme
MKIADLRVVLADIPVKRPHKMSFTTLETVNFVFVRLETSDGHVGWGEAACLGGPTWSEESAESVAVTIERYIAPWLVGRDPTAIEALRIEMATRVQGNPFARAAVEMALWDLAGRALGVPVHRLLGGRVRDRVPLSRSGTASSRSRPRRAPWPTTSCGSGASGKPSVPAFLFVSMPTRDGTGRPRSRRSGRSSPTASTSSSSRCRAGTSKGWP